jgi:hemerythrin-like domain-containing protein
MPMSPSGEWFNRFNRLKDMIQQHVRFEESTIFQDTAKVLDNTQLQVIMDDYKKSEEGARESMVGAGFTREGPELIKTYAID